MSLAYTLEDEGNHEEAADVFREIRENGANLEG
jgi:pentatricopeptide repeat protein